MCVSPAGAPLLTWLSNYFYFNACLCLLQTLLSKHHLSETAFFKTSLFWNFSKKKIDHVVLSYVENCTQKMKNGIQIKFLWQKNLSHQGFSFPLWNWAREVTVFLWSTQPFLHKFSFIDMMFLVILYNMSFYDLNCQAYYFPGKISSISIYPLHLTKKLWIKVGTAFYELFVPSHVVISYSDIMKSCPCNI